MIDLHFQIQKAPRPCGASCPLFRLASVIPLIMMMIGCGPSGIERYPISGTVTYQGQPVKHGTIMFEPDTSKGNSGAAGSATIVDGKFDSATEGTGFTGGPQIVSIQGFSGVDANPEYAPYGTPIGEGKSYIKSFDFPENEAVEQDFEMADVIDE
ncbi:hypothetical protein Poly24_10170 [Rosistilla carotiformis]|uniref:Uncharacterized protein n=1 Tax=Rosistilla carotiformis TaxID=2528017 RepID=A0A518JP56_9BACT|nr:hypothetical protein [Rosistilla carotiformis]QDV67324.1 hypothetical protein Poly24_10170 [Rosistilla carotiformis]